VYCSLVITPITDLYATTATRTLLVHRAKKAESVQPGTLMRYYTDPDVQMMVGKLIYSCVFLQLVHLN
jgi:hypothetical protein